MKLFKNDLSKPILAPFLNRFNINTYLSSKVIEFLFKYIKVCWLDLLERKQSDWKAVLELTENLRKIDPTDPVKYDFALFGMGVLE